ncbi:MAG: metal-sulfur cluster assembly factor [Candidatus Nealsonbacteria bacterium]|nr:metal-sulfur cluster assembly factor [Candidatus Nealsonbacteria bacterium]
MSVKDLKKEVLKKLKNVFDPEIHISLVDLGLIYDVREADGRVKIKMTLTSLGCPLFGSIEEEIKEAVLQIKGVKNVEVELVFDPPWTKDMLSKEAKTKLGIN